jgi:hypothetical protein
MHEIFFLFYLYIFMPTLVYLRHELGPYFPATWGKRVIWLTGMWCAWCVLCAPLLVLQSWTIEERWGRGIVGAWEREICYLC